MTQEMKDPDQLWEAGSGANEIAYFDGSTDTTSAYEIEAPVAKKQQPKRKQKAVLPSPKWLEHAVKDEAGRIIPNVANCLLALRQAPELADCFTYNEMMRASYLIKALPFAGGGLSNQPFEPERVSDSHVTLVQEWLQHNGLPKIAVTTVFDAINVRARECSHHPVRDYLDSLQWDKRPRLDSWLAEYLGVADSDYAAAIGEMFLISMVARIYQPGCKVDYTLVLEGDQGLMKSSACAVIGGEWFSDSMPDITQGKDAAIHLGGKWLIEIGELAALTKAEVSHLKAFLTRRVERYRPPYGRHEVEEPRQSVFIATTNEAGYLKDPTGGRRFWPVTVTMVDLQALAADRNQLFAEAVHLFKAGKAWWPDARFEAKHIKPEQEARQEQDAWEESVMTYLERNNIHSITLSDLGEAAIGLNRKDINKERQKRLSDIMTRNGWARSKTKVMGYHPYLSPERQKSSIQRGYHGH